MSVESANAAPPAPFEELDFIYMPSRDVAADVRHLTEVLGARLRFAVEGMGTRVAMVELTEGPPHVILADHLEGDSPVLVYRVNDLSDAMRQLESRGWRKGHMLEIPHGPVCSFKTPGGHRLAIYELSRPEVASTSPAAATSNEFPTPPGVGSGPPARESVGRLASQ